MSRVDSGTPVAVMLTAYSATLLADGEDWTELRIAVTDSMGCEISSADDSIRVWVDGDGTTTSPDGESLPVLTETARALRAGQAGRWGIQADVQGGDVSWSGGRRGPLGVALRGRASVTHHPPRCRADDAHG